MQKQTVALMASVFNSLVIPKDRLSALPAKAVPIAVLVIQVFPTATIRAS